MKSVVRLAVLASMVMPFSIASATESLTGRTCRHIFGAERPLSVSAREISYVKLGKGPETIVLLHGMGGSKESWGPVAQRLSRDYRVIYMDIRGHGQSATRGTDYSSSTLARDLKALVDHLKIDKFHLVGHSMGGRVAARFTAMFPERVKNLVIEDMDLMRRTSADPEKLRRSLLKASEVSKRLASQKFKTPEEYLRAIEPFFNAADLAHLSEAVEPDRRGHWGITAFPPEVMLRYWNQGNADNILPDLARTKVPTTLLRGDAERFWVAFTDEGVRRARAEFPEARIVEVPDAEHGIHSSQPWAFLRELHRALEPR